MGKLNEKETIKLNEIKKFLAGECSKKEAAENLELSTKQLGRLISRYNKEGEAGLIHKSRNRESRKKVPQEIKEKMINLYVTEYPDYNFTHFYEETKEIFNLSLKTVSNILTEAEIISPEAQHKTVTEYNANMRKIIRKKRETQEQKIIYERRQETKNQSHIRRSSLLYNYGQEIQIDAAFAMWYGEKARALHLAVDKATKRVLCGYFDVQETTRAYFTLLMDIILKYGIPKKIKTDKRGTFSINNTRTKGNLNTTQFGRICEELEIHLSSSSDPLFKPNVERANKTFKGRLIAELRHENIIDDKEANKYLNEVFIPKMNAKFAYEIDNEKNDMRENTYTEEELKIIISEQYVRKIDNASAVKYYGNYYVPIDTETGEIISFSQGTLCTLVIAYDYSYWCYIEEKLYILAKIKAPEKKIPKRTTKTIEEINRSKAHKPAPNHPWRNYKN